MSGIVELRREGLYCPAGDFYIDPSKRVPRAVITHAHGDHARSGCGAYWGSAQGLGLLRERIGGGASIVGHDYGERFQLGRAEVSFHSAGHILGSAQVRIEVDGEVAVVSGDYKRDDDPSCSPFESVPCDIFITEATFAAPKFVWPDPSAVAAEVYDWWQACKRDGQTALLYCYALGKAQRVLAELARFTDETVYVHRTMSRLIRLYRKAGITMLPTEPVGSQRLGTDFRGRLVLAPPSESGTSWPRRFAPHCSGFVSGWNADGGRSPRLRYDRGFTLSDHADWPSLLRTIEESGARRVRIVHGDGTALIAHLRERGIDAAPLAGADPAPTLVADAPGAGSLTPTQEIEPC